VPASARYLNYTLIKHSDAAPMALFGVRMFSLPQCEWQCLSVVATVKEYGNLVPHIH
jgi:hypothetical protein